MRILYVVHKFDYGQPSRGYCYEHFNFYEPLVAMGHDVLYFDFPTLARQLGPSQMNRRLLEVVASEKPQLMFTVAWGDDLDQAVVRHISQETDTTTMNWFCDDHWKFDLFSKHWAPCFNWVVTTAQCALPKYDRIGYQNVIKSQWGCNHLLYRRLGLSPKYDVTFVGMPHGIRRAAVQALRDAGIDVQVWGTGWPNGRLSQTKMIEVFNQSRIVLNFSEPSGVGNREGWLNTLSRRYVEHPLGALPGGWRAATLARSLASKLTWGRSSKSIMPRQIKGRVFEVAGCGSFVLTGQAENLRDYYRRGQEVVVFDHIADLIEKIRYYLSHDAERESIAWAGYEKTLREHTYECRFSQIFEEVGLSHATRGNGVCGVESVRGPSAAGLAA